MHLRTTVCYTIQESFRPQAFSVLERDELKHAKMKGFFMHKFLENYSDLNNEMHDMNAFRTVDRILLRLSLHRWIKTSFTTSEDMVKNMLVSTDCGCRFTFCAAVCQKMTRMQIC
jgi:hypothetical protein